jgi:hypothetical protein
MIPPGGGLATNEVPRQLPVSIEQGRKGIDDPAQHR